MTANLDIMKRAMDESRKQAQHLSECEAKHTD